MTPKDSFLMIYDSWYQLCYFGGQIYYLASLFETSRDSTQYLLGIKETNI